LASPRDSRVLHVSDWLMVAGCRGVSRVEAEKRQNMTLKNRRAEGISHSVMEQAKKFE
jgi:hypothetical protein